MKTKSIKTLKECIELSLKEKSNKELDADMIVEVNNQHWHCYTVALSHREFTLYCDEGTASFVVDSYGDRHSCELVDWEIDEDFRLNKLNKISKLKKLQTIEDRTAQARRFMMGTKKNPKKINVRKNPQEIQVYYEISIHDADAFQILQITDEGEALEAAERLRYFLKTQGKKLDVYLYKVIRTIHLSIDGEFEDEAFDIDEIEF